MCYVFKLGEKQQDLLFNNKQLISKIRSEAIQIDGFDSGQKDKRRRSLNRLVFRTFLKTVILLLWSPLAAHSTGGEPRMRPVWNEFALCVEMAETMLLGGMEGESRKIRLNDTMKKARCRSRLQFVGKCSLISKEKQYEKFSDDVRFLVSLSN